MYIVVDRYCGLVKSALDCLTIIEASQPVSIFLLFHLNNTPQRSIYLICRSRNINAILISLKSYIRHMPSASLNVSACQKTIGRPLYVYTGAKL